MSELICDTSVVQYLHQVHLLHILPALGSPVVLPEAVVVELEQGRARGIDLPDLSALGWLTIRTASVRPLLSHAADLGPGESEVLWLALECPNSIAVLDDAVARQQRSSAASASRGSWGCSWTPNVRDLSGPCLRFLITWRDRRGFRKKTDNTSRDDLTRKGGLAGK